MANTLLTSWFIQWLTNIFCIPYIYSQDFISCQKLEGQPAGNVIVDGPCLELSSHRRIVHLLSADKTGNWAKLVLHSSPLIWSTDVRSTRLYGQLLADPNHRTLTLISNPDIRSARLYGQFSLDKTPTLQAAGTVQKSQSQKQHKLFYCFFLGIHGARMSLFHNLKLKRRKLDTRSSSDGKYSIGGLMWPHICHLWPKLFKLCMYYH